MWLKYMPFTIEQRVFINNTFANYSSQRKCYRKFSRLFPGIHSPSKCAIYKIAKKFCETGSVLDKKGERKCHALNEGKLR